ncbi:hypothetical protein PHYPSEUDO_014992 [Phytophthora pseudosyringae]|uniref:Uncharacterized protein n=1 Tax=Phytophthora pseudosyringae TaxID=221518 RepID=A0A8T1WJM9_9STRA|nr:hypothetical protein PHYPSEUDO_014992 [Phytophthora pseudosyringae]
MPRSSSNSHLSWLEPASSSGWSPMQLLVAWLGRHYATYVNSITKIEMLEELCQGMRDAGYPGCTVHALRSKINSLRREARRERIGDHRHSRAFQQFQQSLVAIFAREDQDEDTSETETLDENGGTADDHEVIADFHTDHRMLVPNHALDVTEIRRRFELLCARHTLEQRGVAMELIDRILPLPED